MTNTTHRTEIQIETHDVTIIRRQRREFSVYCNRCEKDVSTFTSQQISSWLRMIQTGDIHLIETDQGKLVCRNSLEA